MEVDKLKEDPINPKSSSSSCSSSSNTNPSKMAENQKAEARQQHKKQVRRRLHTSRPYQERLLNMAEARREIVTALKYHRAAMKKAAAGEQNRQPQAQPQTPPEPPAPRCRPRKIPKSSTDQRNLNYPQSNFDYNNNNNNNNLRNLCYPWMMNSNGSWSVNENNNVEIVLPEQTLGLNLNLQDFNNLEAKLFSNGSVSGSSSVSMATDEEGLNSGNSGSGGGGGGGGGGMHVAVGEEEMAEIRWIGEKHSVEWSDKMNLVKSAWWFRFMKMESGESSGDQEGFEFGDPLGLDQILEFPDWMNNDDADDACFQQQLFNDYHFFHDHHPSALPCMDIGEFEGMDGEWLA